MVDINTTGNAFDVRKRVMGYSILFSLVLHICAALVFIVAGGVVTGVDKAPKFIVQEVLLGPPVSTLNQSIAPPSLAPSSDKTPLTPTSEQESVEQVQAQSPDQSSVISINSKEGDILSIPLGLGMTHGYFSGLADGRTLKDDVRGYYFEMVEKINQEWWSQAAQLNEPISQDGIFDVLLQRDGTIVSIQIKQGTGLPEADRLLLEIIKKSSPLPPLPPTYELGMFRAPLRIKAPSFLFRLGK